MEELKERTPQQINQEYCECAVKLGDKQFRIDILFREITELKDKMHALNDEMKPLRGKEGASAGI